MLFGLDSFFWTDVANDWYLVVIVGTRRMTSNNHPERFPTDEKFTQINNRVSSLIHKYKVDVRK